MSEQVKTEKETHETNYKMFRPKLTFYHPNPKGTGSACQFELHPAHDDTDGSVWVRIANQTSTEKSRGSMPSFARFDWENCICVKLEFSDLTKMLHVLRGDGETLEDKYLCHQGVKGTSCIYLRHVTDPKNGYFFEIFRTLAATKEEKSARIFLRPNEALGLRLAIEGSMSVICFGIPMVIRRDTSQYRAAYKEKNNG